MKISLYNFRKIDSASIELNDITVLIGGNNSGKSSILQGIHFFNTILQSCWIYRTGKDSRPAKTLSLEQLIYQPTNDLLSLRKDKNLSQNNSIEIKYTYKVKDKTDEFEINIKKGKNKNISIEFDDKNSFFEYIKKEDEFLSLLVPGLAGIPINESFINKGRLRRIVSQGNSNSYMRNILFLMHKEGGTKELEEILSTVFEEPIHISLQFDEDMDEYINVFINEKPIELIGTGILQLMHISSYILYFKPKILLLDEPDSHLHPQNQIKLSNLLKKISKDYDIKIILSTHSRHFFNSIIGDGTNIYITKNGGLEKQDYSKSSIIKSLMEIGALDKIDSFSKIEYLFLSEDSNNSILDDIISNNFGFNFKILTFNGAGNVRYIPILSDILLQEYNFKIICITDRDGLFDEEIRKIEEKFSDIHGNVILCFPDYCTQESYLLTKENLEDKLGKEVTEDIIEKILQDNDFINHIISDISVKRSEAKTKWNKYISTLQSTINELKAREIRENYETLLKVANGKTLLKRIKKLLNENYGNHMIDKLSDFPIKLSKSRLFHLMPPRSSESETSN